MNDESRPENETAHARSTHTVPRNPDLERWLVTQALDALMPDGMIIGFIDQVQVRMDADGDTAFTEISTVEVADQVQAAAVDMVSWLLLLAYRRRQWPVEPNFLSLIAIVRDAAGAFYAARRIEGGNDA